MTMVENKDFELVPDDKGDSWNIRILTGMFSETIFEFGAIAVSEDQESLNFDFTVKFFPYEEENPENNEALQDVVGKILISLIETAIEEKNEESGNNDTEESSVEGKLHQKSSSVSKE